jgi:hypothetical protein
MQNLKKLFGSPRNDESRKTALTNALIAEKLARLSDYKGEIQSWEAKRDRILGDLQQRQQGLKAEMSQLRGIDDPVDKRYMMQSQLQQWRDMDLTIECTQQEMYSRITELAAQFTHELAVLASEMPGLKTEDKEALVHSTVLVVIEELIGICERLDDTRAKPELARAISALIDTAAALDASAVHAHAQIVHFRKKSPYLRGGGTTGTPREIMSPRLRRQQPPARHHQQQPHRSLDE